MVVSDVYLGCVAIVIGPAPALCLRLHHRQGRGLKCRNEEREREHSTDHRGAAGDDDASDSSLCAAWFQKSLPADMRTFSRLCDSQCVPGGASAWQPPCMRQPRASTKATVEEMSRPPRAGRKCHSTLLALSMHVVAPAPTITQTRHNNAKK